MTRPIERAWALQQQWSAAASEEHEQITRFRTANLMLLVIAAAVGAAAGMLHDEPDIVRVLAIIGAVLLGSAGLIQQRFLGTAKISDWIVTRLASEQLKAAVWRALGLGQGDDLSNASMLAAIETAEGRVASRQTPLGPGVAATKALPSVTSIADYTAQRVANQASWHENKAATLRRKSRALRAAELAATIVGVAASAVAAGFTDWILAPAVAAITTIAAALAAHLSASKYDRVAVGYESTARRLATLSQTFSDQPTPDDTARFVDDVERVLAEQNNAWLNLFSAD